MKTFTRLALFFFMAFSLVYAVERPRFEDFLACYEKNRASAFTYEGMSAFALSENLLAVLKSPNKKLNKYVKYDPFLNLYLVRTEFSLIPSKTYDEQNLTRNDWVGILDNNKSYIGHLKYLAQNINERDQLDFATKVGQLNTPCCSRLGISLADGSFIGNRYLNHFAKYNDVYWGDIGVDFIFRDGKIYVDNVRSGSAFLVNDEVVSLDGQSAKDLRVLNEKILFADRGSTLYFHILRDNSDLNISAQVFAKDLPPSSVKTANISTANITSGANDLGQRVITPPPQGYRTNLGLSLNKNLIVTKIEANSKAAAAGFMLGDKILRINNEEVKTTNDVTRILGAGNDFNFLIARSVKRLPIQKDETRSASTGDGIFNFFIRLSK